MSRINLELILRARRPRHIDRRPSRPRCDQHALPTDGERRARVGGDKRAHTSLQHHAERPQSPSSRGEKSPAPKYRAERPARTAMSHSLLLPSLSSVMTTDRVSSSGISPARSAPPLSKTSATTRCSFGSAVMVVVRSPRNCCHRRVHSFVRLAGILNRTQMRAAGRTVPSTLPPRE